MGYALPLSDAEWSAGLVESFPLSWQERLIGVWQREKKADRRAGNLGLLQRVNQLADAGKGGIRPDADDGEICRQAEITARDMESRLMDMRAVWIGRARSEAEGPEFMEAMAALLCRGLLDERGLADLWPGPGGVAGAEPLRLPKSKVTRAGAIKRLQCARWWRRAYRKLHARTVEACAIGIGLVSRQAGLYASDESVRRRSAQNLRNAASLESVIAVNDHGQDYTLAELAAKGTANKSIRRVELLTRIAGFELIAKDCGHIGFMVTMTCPSRFHKKTTRADGRVVDNPRFDGSTPDQAQRYLSKAWSRARAAADRRGLGWYGFRIAEPQHDGTPHWHCLLFMPQMTLKCLDSAEVLRWVVRKYFLWADSPDEPGAAKHRVDFEAIDWSKGSAVGYVIKYVSKNIDGHGVGLDLFGNDAITSSQRVEAWASTWRTRQFQQIGGPPVGVWRELRRVHPDNMAGEDAPEPLREALSAMNIAKVEPGAQALAWKRYTAAQGGVGTRRADLRIQLDKEQTGECGRYGEVMPARPVGVRACGWQYFRNHIHQMLPNHPPFKRPVFQSVESERAQWVVGQGDRATAIASALRVFEAQRSGAAAQPRIHVNNCTGGSMDPPASMFAPVHRHRPKLRRFRVWERPEREGNGMVGGITKEMKNERPHRTPAQAG